jgi:hypothetical protein
VTRIRNRGARPSLLALVATTMLVALAPSAAQAGNVAPSAAYQFPSASSTVVGSVGFIDADEVGYFWSVSRGDSVSETFVGAGAIDGAGLKVTVLFNNLNSGAHVDWSLEINSVVIARFRVAEGFLGSITLRRTFAAIPGPNYDAKLMVLNEVAFGQGSITLSYAGSSAHFLLLKPV